MVPASHITDTKKALLSGLCWRFFSGSSPLVQLYLFLPCLYHLHLLYNIKPRRQVYNKSWVLWVGSIKPQMYLNLQQSPASVCNQELNPHIIHTCIWSVPAVVSAGWGSLFLKFLTHYTEIQLSKSFYNHARKQILRNVCTKTFLLMLYTYNYLPVIFCPRFAVYQSCKYGWWTVHLVLYSDMHNTGYHLLHNWSAWYFFCGHDKLTSRISRYVEHPNFN